ncbi:hypothetical protein H310_09369 [Aphanomyces invadans]|uniref:Bromo domain-containing protein n=1 Tax=Aphanomyces invadans TaxID=157072 RepID=A0A024TWR5_9STRA|nr:hypothetical protein H310_09369 [Aphanomyces invadans]ETV98086.1 hypothetical protein H310_09369 [Aphanomyces invadans]|eukprot:XP_008873647.1 hypothetical protein H310_09369 [Aphanomyces invadans]
MSAISVEDVRVDNENGRTDDGDDGIETIETVKVDPKPITTYVTFMDLYRRKKKAMSLEDIVERDKRVQFDTRDKSSTFRYGADELDVLTESSHTYSAAWSRQKQLQTLKQNRIGKPNKRFPSGTSIQSSAIPYSLPTIPISAYHRVHQIPWENAILWGDESDTTPPFVPEEDESPFETGIPSSAQRTQTKRRQSPVYQLSSYDSAAFAFPDDDFDMTKPRQYRWEMPRRPATATTKASSSSEKTILPCALNPALLDSSWQEAIGWDDTEDMPPSRILLDENDVHLILSNPLVENVRATLRIPQRKMGAIEIRKEELKKQMSDKNTRLDVVRGNLEWGQQTAESRFGEMKRSKDPRIIKNMGHVHHSLPAIKLSLTKPELPLAKLREFHRPRGKFKIHERMPVVSAKNAEKSKSVKVADADLNDPTLSQIKKTSDLNPTAGGKLMLLEYTEQYPPMQANPGMASRVLHYWRPPDTRGEGKADEGAGKGKERKKKPHPPTVSLGEVVTLGDNEDSPFVGDVPAGKMVTSLNSKLFKIPIFPHSPRPNFLEPFADDKYEIFLVARSVSKKGKGASTMYIMELPMLYLAGQVEPQIEVPAPNSRSANDFIRPYMSFHILRLFKKTSDGERLKIEDITRAFPNQSGTAIRKRMKEVATFERGGNDSGWWKRKQSSDVISEEEIRASVSPESVCLYESMMSGHQRLLDMGLTKQFTPTGVQAAISQMTKRLKYRESLLSSRILVPQGYTGRHLAEEEKKLWNRDPVLVTLRNDIQIARSINEQLLLTPWNLTNGYVECHLQGKGSGMLQLGGLGDPSARGEGFSFIRVPQSRAKKKEENEELAVSEAEVQKAVAAVTGTTADLRKLKMKEAGDVLKNLGMAEEDILKLRRWDRIYMVRELSTRASAHGMAGTLNKFVRGARKSLSAQQQEYRRKCDVIYLRQLEVLSSTEHDFEDDSESGSDDDDDFIEDLEDDLLGDDVATTNATRGPQGIFKAGGGGLTRTKTTMSERDDAHELRRLMEEMKSGGGGVTASSTGGGGSRLSRPEVDASNLRIQLKASGIKDSLNTSMSSMTSTKGNSVASSAIPSPVDPASRAQSPRAGGIRQAIKRTTRIIDDDGTETVKIEFVVDPKAIGRYKAAQSFKERQKKDEERNQLRKRKKLEGAETDKSLLKKQIADELKQLKKKEEATKGYVEMLEKGQDVAAGGRGAIKCTACGQLGHIRTNRNCPLFIESKTDPPPKSVKSDAPLKLTLKKSNLEDIMKEDSNSLTLNLTNLREGARKHQIEKKRKRLQDVAESAEIYKKQYGSKDKKTEHIRLPIARLNGLLEKVLFNLLGMPESALFREPVDGSLIRDYYNIIKRPMDLKRMRAKIRDLEYDSMRTFLADVELMATNSKMYNGELNPITKNAFKVLERAKDDLQQLNTDGALHSLQKLARTQSVS